MKLREAFENHYLPELEATASPRTIESYQATLKIWETLTANPPLPKVTNLTLADFRREMIAAGYAPATFNKTWCCVRAVLNRLSAAVPGNPRGLGLLERTPWVGKLPIDVKFPRIATFEELNAIYSAAAEATEPATEGIPPADWWRCLLALGYSYGPRYRDLLNLRTEGISLLEQRTIRFCAEKTKKWHVLPLNEIAFLHIKRIWSAREMLFPTGPTQSVRRQWGRLKEIAGVSPAIGFHTLRKTCASNYELNFPGTASYILGHALSGVTAISYLNPLASGALKQAVENLPQPDSFQSILHDPERQVNVVVTSRKRARTDWTFDLEPGRFFSGRVQYRRKKLRFSKTLTRLLQALVTASTPLDFADVRRAVFWDRPKISTNCIKSTVQQLRSKLSKTLDVAPGWNVIPYRFGNPQGWILNLPPKQETEK